MQFVETLPINFELIKTGEILQRVLHIEIWLLHKKETVDDVDTALRDLNKFVHEWRANILYELYLSIHGIEGSRTHRFQFHLE